MSSAQFPVKPSQSCGAGWSHMCSWHSLGVEQLGAGVQAHGLTQGTHLHRQQVCMATEVRRQACSERGQATGVHGERGQAAGMQRERSGNRCAAREVRQQWQRVQRLQGVQLPTCALAVVVSAMKAEGILPSSRRPATAGRRGGTGWQKAGQVRGHARALLASHAAGQAMHG